MAVFRFLHISDLHIAEEAGVVNFFEDPSLRRVFDLQWRHILIPSTYCRDLADILAERVARLTTDSPKLDLILISGDLAATGADRDLKNAFRFVHGPADRGWLMADGFPTLNGSLARTPPMFLLCGNHDRFHGRKLNAGGREFDKVFGRYWNPGQRVQIKLIEKVTGNDKLAFVLADFSLLRNSDARGFGGSIGHFGQGRAYRQTVAQLKTATQLIREEHGQVPTVWVMHFAPAFKFRNLLFKWFFNFLEDHRIGPAADEVEVRHIFCGHTHKKRSYPVGGAWAHCAASACMLRESEDNSIHLVEIETYKGEIVRLKRKDLDWSPEERDFIEMGN